MLFENLLLGQYQQAPPIPYTPGMEYSGTVAYIGKGFYFKQLEESI